MLLDVFSRARSDGGFTLIELLVVILVIGILAAIGIPTLLGQSAKGNDAQAKSMARSAQTAAEIYASDHDGTYQGASLAVLKAIEPTLGDTSGAVLITLNPDSSGQGYTVSATSTDKSSFTITRNDDGTIVRTCSQGSSTSTGGCRNGTW